MQLFNYQDDIQHNPLIEAGVTLSKSKEEFISFQLGDKLGDNIAEQIDLFLKDVSFSNAKRKFATSDAPQLRAIEAIIKKRTHITVKLSLINSVNAYTVPLYATTQGALTNDFLKGLNLQEYLLSLDKQGYYGTELAKQQNYIANITAHTKIDLNKVVFDGPLADYGYVIGIDIFGFSRIGLTPEEIAAALLHELGHIITHIYQSFTLAKTNQILTDLAKTTAKTPDTKTFTLVLERNRESLAIDQKDIDAMKNTTSRTVFMYKFTKAILGGVKEQMRSDWYTKSSSETMANIVVARFGYGKHLVAGLYKMGNVFQDEEIVGVSNFTRFLDTIRMIALPIFICFRALVIPGIAGAVLGAMFGFISFGCFILSSFITLTRLSNSPDNRPSAYVTNRDNFTKMKQQYVRMLSELELDTATMKAIINDIESIDGFIGKLKQYEHFIDRIQAMTSIAIKSNNLDREMQLLMEDLASNTLFVQSAKLKTL